ncbi:MAG TPA: 4-hydroxy-tetrahydrodipicolinate synthase [Acidimicrobiales bacterium]|nr:4-hydroxy-tetrahydrodipicolinate synthase [Acidimicrobiales bacterium]
MARFGRVLTAMVTPFDREGALDLDGAAKLASWLVEQGNDGLVVAGTTGESPTLTHAEQIELIRTVCQAVAVPVLAGAGSNDTRAAVELTELAAGAGAAGILSVTPYYNRPSQAGLAAHFRAVADATDLPVVLYDIPIRTGRKIDTATILDLAHNAPNIIGVKDAAANPAETAALLADAPAGFDVYSGDDPLTLPLLAIGAVGVISVAAHWCAREIGEMIAAFASGDVTRAREINARLIPSYVFQSGDRNPNPIPTKALLKVLGLPGGDCRPPMGPEPDDLQDRARAILAGLGR